MSVAITGVTNATNPSTVFFSDTTSADLTTPAVNTNTVSIGNAVSAVPTVTSVNPTAVTAAGSPFTVVGSTFNTTTAPVVCFVAVGTTAPAPGATAATTCPSTPASGYAPATGVTTTTETSTEIQGTSPTGLADGAYNVVVYNYDASSTSYLAASATSANTEVTIRAGLNFVPENGVRVADSRLGTNLPRGTIAAGTTVAMPVATAFTQSLTLPTNIPAAATAVTVNITAIGPSAQGNLQVTTTTGAACPTTSSSTPVTGTSTVNFQPPQDTNNQTVVSLAGGVTYVCIRANGSPVNATVDVTGYSLAGAFTPSAHRILNTIPGQTSTGTATSGLQGPLHGGIAYRFADTANLTAGTTVALNVTAVGPTAQGNLRAFPEPGNAATGAPPAPSNVPAIATNTYIPNVDGGTLVVTQVGLDGYIDLYSSTAGLVNVVVDEVGTFPTGSSVHSVGQPYRLFDSRPGGLASGASATVNAAPSNSGSYFIPSSALAVIGQLSDITPAAQGNLRTYASGDVIPNTASAANYPGQTRENEAMSALNPTTGQFSIYSSGSSTNTTFDATAYVG